MRSGEELTDDIRARERLVKSEERVRNLGEVFTPEWTVQEILNLLPDEVWQSHPATNFLEPACGDGNFLVEILRRKLQRIAADRSGRSVEEITVILYALEAVGSIYAVDISEENVVGGVPGHEFGARDRLLIVFAEWLSEQGKGPANHQDVYLSAARWIVEHNIIVGNMLASDAAGKPTRRREIPIIEYSWQPKSASVELKKTTLGDIEMAAEEERTGELRLFGSAPAVPYWEGSILEIAGADRIEAPKLEGPVRNARGGAR